MIGTIIFFASLAILFGLVFWLRRNPRSLPKAPTLPVRESALKQAATQIAQEHEFYQEDIDLPAIQEDIAKQSKVIGASDKEINRVLQDLIEVVEGLPQKKLAKDDICPECGEPFALTDDYICPTCRAKS